MAKKLQTNVQNPGRYQVYLLLTFGIICLLGAWLLHPNPFAYPVGLLLFGLGMLLAAALHPYRLVIAGLLVTCVGLAVFIAFKQLLPGGGALLIPAIGIALLLIALMARMGFVGKGALSPGIIVLLVGLVEYPPFAHLLPANYASAILSLWFPGIGLLLLGLFYLLVGRRAPLANRTPKASDAQQR